MRPESIAWSQSAQSPPGGGIFVAGGEPGFLSVGRRGAGVVIATEIVVGQDGRPFANRKAAGLWSGETVLFAKAAGFANAAGLASGGGAGGERGTIQCEEGSGAGRRPADMAAIVFGPAVRTPSDRGTAADCGGANDLLPETDVVMGLERWSLVH